jgi:hypothetical protein
MPKDNDRRHVRRSSPQPPFTVRQSPRLLLASYPAGRGKPEDPGYFFRRHPNAHAHRGIGDPP